MSGDSVGKRTAKELADKLRSWIPIGDGYNDPYAHDMEDAAQMIELLAAQRRQHRAKHKSYKRRAEAAEAALGEALEYLHPYLDTGDSRTAEGWAVGLALILARTSKEPTHD